MNIVINEEVKLKHQNRIDSDSLGSERKSLNLS